MLSKFRSMLMSIQNDYPYYFKSVEGLSGLLKVDPTAGIRITPENGVLTIKCHEALDLRITELLSMYRKIAWDDVYQRWVLPDMMRYFQMKIYVSEIRNFHISNRSSESPANESVNDMARGRLKVLDTISGVLNTVKSWIGRFTSTDAWGMMNNSLNDYMPTICVTCNQCEFVIDDTMQHLGQLSSYNKEAAEDLQIKIRVGNISEAQAYPLSGDKAMTYTSAAKVNNAAGTSVKAYGNYDRIDDEELYRTTQYGSANYTVMDMLDTKYGRGGYTKFSGTDSNAYYESQPAKAGMIGGLIQSTINNAITYGVNWLDNKANDALKKLMNTPIGKGPTFNEAMNALNSKDIVTMYATIRDAMNRSSELKEQDKKDRNITLADNAFKSYIKEIARMPVSTATAVEKKIAAEEIMSNYKKSVMTTNRQDASARHEDMMTPDIPDEAGRTPKIEDVSVYGAEYHSDKVDNPYTDGPDRAGATIRDVSVYGSEPDGTMRAPEPYGAEHEHEDVFSAGYPDPMPPSATDRDRVSDGHDSIYTNYGDFNRQYNENEGMFRHLSEATRDDASISKIGIDSDYTPDDFINSPYEDGPDNRKEDVDNPYEESADNKRTGIDDPYEDTADEKKTDLDNPYEESEDNRRTDIDDPYEEAGDTKKTDLDNPYEEAGDIKKTDLDNPYEDSGDPDRKETVTNPYEDMADAERPGMTNPYEDTEEGAKSDVIQSPEIDDTEHIHNDVSSPVDYPQYGPVKSGSIKSPYREDGRGDGNGVSRPTLDEIKKIAESLDTTTDHVISIAKILDDADLTSEEMDDFFKIFAGMTVDVEGRGGKRTASNMAELKAAVEGINAAADKPAAELTKPADAPIPGRKKSLPSGFADMLTELRRYALSKATDGNNRIKATAAAVYAVLRKAEIRKIADDNASDFKKTVIAAYKSPDGMTAEEKTVIKAVFEATDEAGKKKDITIQDYVENVDRRLYLKPVGPVENPAPFRSTTDASIEKQTE